MGEGNSNCGGCVAFACIKSALILRFPVIIKLIRRKSDI